MQSEQKLKIETLLWDLILQANRVREAVDKGIWFRVNCWEMEKQVSQLQQILDTLLLCLTFGPIHPVISEVSGILQEALNLAGKFKHKTFFCRLFNGAQTTNDFDKLFRLLDFCIAYMNWFLIMYNPDFNSAFNEMIFPSLPQILSNDSYIPSAWSCMLLIMLNSDDVGIVEGLLLCLAKLVGAEHGESRCNYLTSIMEITAAAESNLDLRCKAFKTNSPGAKAIVERLLRVINQSEDPKLQVLAIRSIGSLARIFSERTNHHVIDALVLQLGNGNQEVATEAVVALINFACEENYLCKAHSKRMIELNAVQPLVKLLTDGEWTRLQLHGLELTCYLALNADYSKAMEEARVRTAIERLVTGKKGHRTVVAQHPELKELVAKALRDLTLYYEC